MKIMLQGYLHNANFGDMLYARLFYEKCKAAGFQEVDFFQFRNYGIGQFCRNELGYTAKKSFLGCFRADAFVLISGGSFWNDAAQPNDAKVRYRRFILPALLYRMMHKPVYVLGVGGGPVDTPWLRRKMVRVLNGAKTVYFRDEATKRIFEEYGVTNAAVTADTALVIRPEMTEAFAEHDVLRQAAQNRKILLLHIPDGKRENGYFSDVIVPGLIAFLKEHTEYYPVLSRDNVRNIGREEKALTEKAGTLLSDSGIDFYDYRYRDSMQMCSLINETDCIVTCKLHVGVIGASFGKSVVAFPVHREKTENFYRMIGESDRCVNASALDPRTVYEQLVLFHDKPIRISEEMREKAETNLSALDDVNHKG